MRRAHTHPRGAWCAYQAQSNTELRLLAAPAAALCGLQPIALGPSRARATGPREGAGKASADEVLGVRRCPKCGRPVTEADVICPGCDFVLDTSFLGEDITDDRPPTPPPNVEDVSMFGEDAVILGDGGGEFESFEAQDTGLVQREVTNARIYVGGKTQALLAWDAIPGRVAGTDQDDVRLSPYEQHVLQFVNGRRPVGRIRKKSGMEEPELKLALAMLADKGLVERVGVVDEERKARARQRRREKLAETRRKKRRRKAPKKKHPAPDKAAPGEQAPADAAAPASAPPEEATPSARPAPPTIESTRIEAMPGSLIDALRKGESVDGRAASKAAQAPAEAPSMADAAPSSAADAPADEEASARRRKRRRPRLPPKMRRSLDDGAPLSEVTGLAQASAPSASAADSSPVIGKIEPTAVRRAPLADDDDVDDVFLPSSEASGRLPAAERDVGAADDEAEVDGLDVFSSSTERSLASRSPESTVGLTPRAKAISEIAPPAFAAPESAGPSATAPGDIDQLPAPAGFLDDEGATARSITAPGDDEDDVPTAAVPEHSGAATDAAPPPLPPPPKGDADLDAAADGFDAPDATIALDASDLAGPPSLDLPSIEVVDEAPQRAGGPPPLPRDSSMLPELPFDEEGGRGIYDAPTGRFRTGSVDDSLLPTGEHPGAEGEASYDFGAAADVFGGSEMDGSLPEVDAVDVQSLPSGAVSPAPSTPLPGQGVPLIPLPGTAAPPAPAASLPDGEVALSIVEDDEEPGDAAFAEVLDNDDEELIVEGAATAADDEDDHDALADDSDEGDAVEVPFEMRRKAAKIFEQAEEDWKKGNKGSARMNAKLAVIYDPSNKRYKQILDAWESEAVGEPKRTGALRQDVRLFEEARLAESRGQYEKACRILQRAIDVNPRAAPVYNLLGVIQATRLKLYKEASDNLLKACDLAPSNLSFKNNLGKVLGMQEGARDKRRIERNDDEDMVKVRKIRPKFF